MTKFQKLSRSAKNELIINNLKNHRIEYKLVNDSVMVDDKNLSELSRMSHLISFINLKVDEQYIF